MSMPANLQQRFEMLRGRFIDQQYLTNFYGLEGLVDNADLSADMARYGETFANPPNPQPGMVDRYVLEGFLQTRRLLPIKWAAARLGMKPTLLSTTLDRRMELPIPLRKPYVWYECLVEEGFSEDLVRTLPQLRFRTFSDHESFCDRLHAALGQTLQLEDAVVQEDKLWCATDRTLAASGLGDFPRRYGYYFDCLTCDPLSAAHALWLDFDKPLNLGPDRCSKLVFARYREDLEEWVAGTRAPDDLERYETFIKGGVESGRSIL